MIRKRDSELERQLRELRAPDEQEAEERSWPVIREAHAGRTPIRPTRRTRQLAVAAAGGLAVIAIGLSPAGAKVGDFVSDVVGITGDDAKPELRSLPAAGELLVETDAGIWIVRDDGSKRLLGEYEEAAWSPNGRYLAVNAGATVAAVDPSGEVQWTITTPGPASDLSWAGSEFDTRIAYRSGGDLYVVAGDGTDERRVARDIGGSRPLWIAPAGLTKVNPAASPEFLYQLVYLDGSGQPHVVDPDTGSELNVHVGIAKLRVLRNQVVADPILGNRRVARVVREHGTSSIEVFDRGRRRTVFSGSGRLTNPVWSPDGRWLVFGWREPDQLVFVQPDRARAPFAINDISEQFEGAGGDGGFPQVSSWVLPRR